MPIKTYCNYLQILFLLLIAFAFLFTYIVVRSTQTLTRKDTSCVAILITVAWKGQRVAQAQFAATLQTIS